MPSSKPAPKKRSVSEITQLIEDLNASGLTVAQFAAQIGVSVATIYNWKRKAQPHGSPASPVPTPVQLIPHTGSSLFEPSTTSGLLLQLPGQVKCRIEPGFDENTLQRLVATLAAFAPC